MEFRDFELVCCSLRSRLPSDYLVLHNFVEAVHNFAITEGLFRNHESHEHDASLDFEVKMMSSMLRLHRLIGVNDVIAFGRVEQVLNKAQLIALVESEVHLLVAVNKY